MTLAEADDSIKSAEFCLRVGPPATAAAAATAAAIEGDCVTGVLAAKEHFNLALFGVWTKSHVLTKP